ncbi:MAG: hypothetical protein JXB32_08580 [Deltaproteobacteria bacterium]|nr:hypothetical protein [Deltaproteobacteria bacterium]
MPGCRPSSRLGLLAAGLAAGCFSSPPDEATPGRNGRGEFFRWDTIHDPTDQVLAPLAVGAVAFVGHSSGGCVESLQPERAWSGCGLLRGLAPGTVFLGAYGARDGLIDWVPLDVVVPTGFVLHFPGGPGTAGAGAFLVVGFRSSVDVVLELQADGRPLMGRAVWDATVEPAGALRVEGYGRYLHIDCLWTGIAELAIHEATTGVTQVVRVDCLDPLPEEDAGP